MNHIQGTLTQKELYNIIAERSINITSAWDFQANKVTEYVLDF